MTLLAPTLQSFFTDRLGRQKLASPRTVGTYRDAFRLLLCWINDQHGIVPSELRLEDLHAEMIIGFLEHLETNRHNSARSRNARLAAIRSLFRYAALRHPDHAALIQQVLAIPQKRFDKALVSYLTQPEIDALLAAPDRTTWEGRRDVALIALAVQTGLRVLNCSTWTAATSTWGQVDTSVAPGRGEESGQHRFPKRPGRFWASGSENAQASLPIHYSPPAPAVASNAVPLNGGSSNTAPSPPGDARP